MANYERLKTWQHADRLAHAVHDLPASWPLEEKYGLISQARRAGFSVAANICEGSSRKGKKKFRHFLEISMGSLSELTDALQFARKRGWAAQGPWAAIEELRRERSITLWFLYKAVRGSEPA
ncbi:MAG: four helix bundle protein [Gemmatimonadota bacterium]